MKKTSAAKVLLLALALAAALSACGKQADEGESLYYLADGGIFKRTAPLRAEQVQLAADKINLQIEAHPEAKGFYLAVIPDKNCLGGQETEAAGADYAEMVDIIQKAVPDAEYIDLFDTLDISDYYLTDIHWRQEKLLPAAQALCEAMGAVPPEEKSFTKSTAGSFLGSLYAQSELEVPEEAMYYMESDATRSAAVAGTEGEALPVYDPVRFEGKEPYDLFLCGAQPVLTIENPDADTDKALVIFRDSFGSSISPLLIGSYAKITLVDLRYIMGSIVPDYADFEGADVLFLYSTALLNSGGILK